MTAYYTEQGERLVTLGSNDSTELFGLDLLQWRARVGLYCSVCERDVEYRSQLDSSARCVECQP